MDADPAVSADLVLVALDAPRSHPPPALPCHVTRAGPPPVGPVRSTPERTKSFFPKRRSVGPEPGRTWFFRIERTGRPAAVRPVSIPLFGSLSTSLTLPGFVPTGKHVCGPLSFIIRGNLHWLAFARPPKASIGSSWYTRPRRPPAGRLPARHAHACHAPSGSAAGASRHHSDRLTFSSRAVSLSKQLLTLGLERGMYRGLGCASAWRSRHRPPLRQTGLTALPWPLRGQRLRRERLRRHQCPARFFRVLCRVCIPLSSPSILLFCFQRVACLPNRLASSRRG